MMMLTSWWSNRLYVYGVYSVLCVYFQVEKWVKDEKGGSLKASEYHCPGEEKGASLEGKGGRAGQQR
jgi:hypothetical protein